jgi:hypothetical protein
LSQKQLYVDPHIQMFFWLNNQLQSKGVWIVIGYSFRDPVIQNIFATNFNKGSNKRMILVDPNADHIRKKDFLNTAKELNA